jgi:hypothetical protein
MSSYPAERTGDKIFANDLMITCSPDISDGSLSRLYDDEVLDDKGATLSTKSFLNDS